MANIVSRIVQEVVTSQRVYMWLNSI